MDYPHYSSQMAHAYGMSGGLLLTSASEYVADPVLDTGQSPVDEYIGFAVGADGATIDSISHGKYAKYLTFAPTQDLTDFPLVEGQVYFIPFTQIKLSAGALYLLKA